MRTPLALLGAVLLTATLGPIVLIAAMLGVQEKPRGVYQWAMHSWCRGIAKISGVRLHVHNPERMSETRGNVYIANHVSWYDIFALASVIPRYTWIAKSELRKIPLFGRAAEAAGIVFIDRDNRKAAFDAYKLAAEDVRRGRSVIICPEGTRGKDYHLRPFKKGPFVLAIAAQVPVVPVVSWGTKEVQGKGQLAIHSGSCELTFLEPIATAGLTYDDRDALLRQVWERIAQALVEKGVPATGAPMESAA